MQGTTKCLRCGGDNVTHGKLESTGKIYSRPSRAKLSTILTCGALVNSLICLDCGHVELLVDTNKARSLVRA
jgi:predicted nucleic-acid-binding Zn-ribbon protein